MVAAPLHDDALNVHGLGPVWISGERTMNSAIVLTAVLAGLSWPATAATIDNGHNANQRALGTSSRHSDSGSLKVEKPGSEALNVSALNAGPTKGSEDLSSGNRAVSAASAPVLWGVQLAGVFSREQAL